jgi:hypothetical protein
MQHVPFINVILMKGVLQRGMFHVSWQKPFAIGVLLKPLKHNISSYWSAELRRVNRNYI